MILSEWFSRFAFPSDLTTDLMTVLLSRFSSVTFAPVAPVPDLLPSPFTSVPDANVLKARDLLREAGAVPAGFRGRAGLMLTVNPDGTLRAHAAFKPIAEAAAKALPDVRAAELWPGLEDEAVPDALLVNGAGQTKTLREFIADVFAPFPVRAKNHGGDEQAHRRREWRGLLADGLTSPAVELIRARNADPDGPRAVGLAEWWVGETPAWEMRFDGTFCQPCAGARFLFEWLLEGLPHAAPQSVLRGAAPQIPVLYEDEAMVVINKPAGLASVPGGSETVSAKSLLEAERGELFVVHRLDMGTSGVLAFAKTKDALRVMNAAFRLRDACKHYVARLEGVIETREGLIDLPLGLNLFDRPKQCVRTESEGGRACLTRYVVRENVETKSGTKTVVDLYPKTGRTHQLRLHCAHALGLGMPIDGDPFYGRLGMLAEDPSVRLCLHAAELTLEHPTTGEPLHITADPEFGNF